MIVGYVGQILITTLILKTCEARMAHCACVHVSIPGSGWLTVHVCMSPWARVAHCACVHDSLGQGGSLCMCA